jgi:hypothetical protein
MKVKFFLNKYLYIVASALTVVILNSNESFAALTSVQAFQQSLYTVTKSRCASCHESTTKPFHASLDIQTAHDAVINNSLANFTTPSSSSIYTKVKGGHHCWSANCTNDANEISSQIAYWKTLMTATTVVNSPSTTTSPVAIIPSTSTSKMKAWRIYNRLAGVPPTSTVLATVASLVETKKIKEAALMAMDNTNFYDLTLKNWIKPWSNIDKSNRVPLNDYVATTIGIIRDNIPFDQLLYGDHLYIAGTGTPGAIPAYDKKSNNHYQKLEDSRSSLKDYLVRVSQTTTTGIKDTAGVLTSRAAGAAFYSAGTNRRATRFTFMNFLCRDFEALHDINITDYHVRRDVERDPGGDSRTYRNKCVGCHAGQDALGGAFAYFDFVNGEMVYTEGVVAAKINKNNSFQEGWITKDNSWVNTWAEGQNANLGWPSQTTGNGVRELGAMLSRSRAFSECMSTKVYELVCLRTPSTVADKKDMRKLADLFQQDENYNMKNLIAETAALCVEE